MQFVKWLLERPTLPLLVAPASSGFYDDVYGYNPSSLTDSGLYDIYGYTPSRLPNSEPNSGFFDEEYVAGKRTFGFLEENRGAGKRTTPTRRDSLPNTLNPTRRASLTYHEVHTINDGSRD